MAGGGDRFCGITMTGDVYGWGYNAEGQLGDGKTVSRAYPGAVVTGGVATSIAAGDLHTCAVVDGTVKCWGENGSGQLGNGNMTRQLVPFTTAVTGATMVAAGSAHTCALVGGQAQCWGENGNGPRGNGLPVEAPSVR
jgi:alpha-tubulin suppressor-like RCC1 family protein